MGFRTLAIRRASWLGAIALLVAPLSAEAEERTLTVTGRAELRVAPDLAVAVLTVTTRARNAEEASAENARRSRDVLEAIRRELDPGDRAETLHYRIQPLYEYPKQGPRQQVGFEVVNSLRVRSHRLDDIGALLDRATAAADVSVQSLGFEIEDPRKHEAEALELAGRDARLRAARMAEGVGVTLRRVRMVREGGTAHPPTPRPMVASAAVRQQSEAATEILPQELKVVGEVEVSYDIQ